MSNPNREFDKTHLSIDMAENRMILHRDYIAHCLRWSHVAKFLMQQHRYKDARIVDIGCGKEVPLAKMLYSNRMSGASYVGVDLNQLEMPEMLQKAVDNGKMEVSLFGTTDASRLDKSLLPWEPNTITCFECFEHMSPPNARRLVQNLYDMMEPGGHLFFSTPVWNGSAAANHVNEPTYWAMGALLEDIGWYIEEHFGTFASQSDYLPHLSEDEKLVFHKLARYYDSNLLATMLAPIHPEHSRNVLWHCIKQEVEERLFAPLSEQPEPWSQHQDYKELNNEQGRT